MVFSLNEKSVYLWRGKWYNGSEQYVRWTQRMVLAVRSLTSIFCNVDCIQIWVIYRTEAIEWRHHWRYRWRHRWCCSSCCWCWVISDVAKANSYVYVYSSTVYSEKLIKLRVTPGLEVNKSPAIWKLNPILSTRHHNHNSRLIQVDVLRTAVFDMGHTDICKNEMGLLGQKDDFIRRTDKLLVT